MSTRRVGVCVYVPMCVVCTDTRVDVCVPMCAVCTDTRVGACVRQVQERSGYSSTGVGERDLGGARVLNRLQGTVLSVDDSTLVLDPDRPVVTNRPVTLSKEYSGRSAEPPDRHPSCGTGRKGSGGGVVVGPTTRGERPLDGSVVVSTLDGAVCRYGAGVPGL